VIRPPQPSRSSLALAAPASPPPPHDPRERERLATFGEWELRDFPVDDVKHAYFAANGFAHVQLWHPRKRISLLTPSKITSGLYEVFPIAGWKLRASSFGSLDAQLRAEHGVRLPSARILKAIDRWFTRGAAPLHPFEVRPAS